MNDFSFQVDLRGIVDLLSHHLYTSPRVYMRELLQNAVDATTARRLAEPDAEARVRIESAGASGNAELRIHDAGIGLTEPQVHQLLATIGRSSKRDQLGFARSDFLGQFGIGLLSCFLVADEIRVWTRAAGAPAVEWTGTSDGRYTVRLSEEEREVGTTVALRARRGAEHWLDAGTAKELATGYGSMLPMEVLVDGARVTVDTPPWELPAGPRRREALEAYCREVFGFHPFDVIDVSVAEVDLVGAAFVLPVPANPTHPAGHRVYLKHMLLTENAESLLPDWAFFVRCVVNTGELRPTASREALYDDSALAAARDAIGERVRGWLSALAQRDPDRLGDFLEVHHLAVKALAVHDDEMLRLVDAWWPVETNVGRMPLRDFRDLHGVLRYTASVREFQQLAAVTAAQGIAVVNGGYVYDSELIERLAEVDPEVRVERLEPTELGARLEPLDAVNELAVRPFLTVAQRALDRLGCEVTVRAFEPASLPALYLLDRSAAFGQQLRASRERTDELWGGVLDALAADTADQRPQLVLNHRNPLVRRMVSLPEPELATLTVRALYGQALLYGQHPLRAADSATLNGAFLGLIDRAMPTAPSTEAPA